ncbi:MAG: HAD-IA family hydrolase [Alphaproteobacteria bacterium]|nr:HAD-IA family hydrolase [Alphaproteobacteria bacterium]
MRALFFDVDGVLVRGLCANPDYERRWDDTIEADLGIARPRMQAEFFARDFSDSVIIGRRDLKSSLQEWLDSTPYTVSAEEVIAYWMEKDSALNQELLFYIKKVKEKRTQESRAGDGTARLFMATNQEHCRAAYLWDRCGLGRVFDEIFYSARLGVRKPEPAFFQKISELADLGAEQPLFFDDRADIVAAAQAHGWEAVLYETIDDFLSHPYIETILGRVPAPQ